MSNKLGKQLLRFSCPRLTFENLHALVIFFRPVSLLFFYYYQRKIQRWHGITNNLLFFFIFFTAYCHMFIGLLIRCGVLIVCVTTSVAVKRSISKQNTSEYSLYMLIMFCFSFAFKCWVFIQSFNNLIQTD